MAARGMPLTTQLSSLCAMVMPPAALIAPRPSAPSSPMPVITTPTDMRLNSCAAEWKSTSADGRCPLTGGPSERTTMARRGRRASRFLDARQFFGDSDRRKLALGGAFGQFDLGNELVGNVFKMAGRRVFWLGKEVHRAKRESLHRGVAALFRMRAEQND